VKFWFGSFPALKPTNVAIITGAMKRKTINLRVAAVPAVRRAMLVLLFVALGGIAGLSQSRSVNQQNALKTLHHRSLRSTAPEKVIAAIKDVASPYLAQPIDKAEPIPADILATLADLLDFGRIRPGDPNFDIMAGQMEYPVWGVLVSLRHRALPTMLKVIENEEMDSLKSKNALSVIRRIVGEDRETIDFLLSEYEKVNSDKGKERVLSAANRIETIH
jgi:hypothetical protein